MSRQAFRVINLRQDSLALVEQCNAIVETYQDQGLRLTLRQLYYQLVSRNIVENTERSYKRVGSIISDARLAGLLDWAAIEDRGRPAISPSQWRNLRGLTDAALKAYRLPRWAGQQFYVELWVEKQALAGVLEPLAEEHHVTLMVNKGYSSQSAMYESAQRLSRYEAQRKVVLYLGDHDPSGEDMVRDVRERLTLFGVRNLAVRKIALTMDQIKEFKAPPNPAKLTDARAKAYIAKYGQHSWELDALPPEELAKLVRSWLKQLVDPRLMGRVLAQEALDKKALADAVTKLVDSSELVAKLEKGRLTAARAEGLFDDGGDEP